MLCGGVTLLAQRTLFTAEGAVSAENGLDVLDGLLVVRPPGSSSSWLRGSSPFCGWRGFRRVRGG